MKNCPVRIVTGKHDCSKCPFGDIQANRPRAMRREDHCLMMGSMREAIGVDHERNPHKDEEFAYFPYSMKECEVKNLIKLCDAFGMSFSFSEGSEYYEKAIKVTIKKGTK